MPWALDLIPNTAKRNKNQNEKILPPFISSNGTSEKKFLANPSKSNCSLLEISISHSGGLGSLWKHAHWIPKFAHLMDINLIGGNASPPQKPTHSSHNGSPYPKLNIMFNQKLGHLSQWKLAMLKIHRDGRESPNHIHILFCEQLKETLILTLNPILHKT